MSLFVDIGWTGNASLQDFEQRRTRKNVGTSRCEVFHTRDEQYRSLARDLGSEARFSRWSFRLKLAVPVSSPVFSWICSAALSRVRNLRRMQRMEEKALGGISRSRPEQPALLPVEANFTARARARIISFDPSGPFGEIKSRRGRTRLASTVMRYSAAPLRRENARGAARSDAVCPRSSLSIRLVFFSHARNFMPPDNERSPLANSVTAASGHGSTKF